MAVNNGVADATGLVTVALVVVSLAVAVGIAAPTLAQYHVVERAAAVLVASVQYAVLGLVTVVAMAAVGAPLYLFATADGGTQALALQTVGAALGGFVGLVGLGWLTERVIERYRAAKPDETAVATDGGESA